MELVRLTDRIWYYPYEEARDRPNLGYIRGDKFSIAVDAGHSKEHTEEFYSALDEAGLPLPQITVLTHWHWDHTFGMHSVHGLCIANERTNHHLREFRERIKGREKEEFFDLDERIRAEYNGKPVIITLADIVFSEEMVIDAGNCPVRVFRAQAPHTDDSTLIYVPNDKVIFLGDSTCGALPLWKREPDLCDALADTIRDTGAEVCIMGHYIPLSAKETIDDLKEY